MKIKNACKGVFFINKSAKGLLFLLLLSVNPGIAQKLLKKTYVGPDITFIQIDTKNCYTVQLDTSAGSEIIVQATLNGEYRNDLMLGFSEQGNTLQVGANFQPSYKQPNDKLGAHKVVSIALHIVLPKNKKVQVYGTSAQVKVAGEYLALEVLLADGSCTMNGVSEIAYITTQLGDIHLNSLTGQVRAESKYGKVYEDKLPPGSNQYNLQTISGNIQITNTN